MKSYFWERTHLQVLFHQNIKTPNLCISVDLGNTRKREFSSPWNKNNFVCQSQHSPEFDKTNLALFRVKSGCPDVGPGNGGKPEGFLGGQDLFAFCTLSSE